jgi:hypothetical protein
MGNLARKILLSFFLRRPSVFDIILRVYIANLKSIVPLPEQGVPIGNPAHINFQPVFPVGETVLALYPDTSCFYRAEVISNPRAEKVSDRLVCILLLNLIPDIGSIQ